MATYRIKIVGVHYAVNADSTSATPETEAMHLRTAERLRELDEARPRVVLMPEPSNPVDARAVMARTQGKRIGYVNKEQLDTVHALLQAGGGRPLVATICEVEARKHGWLFVEVKTEAEVPVEPITSLTDEWKSWTSTLPSIPTRRNTPVKRPRRYSMCRMKPTSTSLKIASACGWTMPCTT